jgi:hypothetical protein
MKIPTQASVEIQNAFKEIWSVLDALSRRDIDLNGRRILNAGQALDPHDLVRKSDVENAYGFNTLYQKLKVKGLDDFPGQLRELQPAKVSIVTSTTNPKATDVGKIFWEKDTGVLKFTTGTGYVTINYQGIVGEYADRPSGSTLAALTSGVMYYATDQNILYIVSLVGGSPTWVYLAGIMTGTLSPDERPSLAATDAGVLFYCSDTKECQKWSGTAWIPFTNAIDSPTFYIDSVNHRTGVGTNTPGAKLDVAVSDDNDGIRVQRAASPAYLEGPRVMLAQRTNNGTSQIFAAIKSVAQSGDDTNFSGDLQFSTVQNGVLVVRLTVGYDGAVAINGAFGCNGATPRTAAASGGAAGAAAGTATSGGYGFVSAEEMNDFISAVNAIKDLVNNIRSALVANGIMS